MKTLTFHSDLGLVTVSINGLPVTLHGEVDIVVKEPTKKSSANEKAWAVATSQGAECCTVETCPKGKQNA